ncbi:MAG: 3-phosphoshikimate 1-carboxyvinyltransferase [Myxococcota bacterium]
MTTRSYRIRPTGILRGEARVPGDKSIGHRSLIFASLAHGSSLIRGLSGGKDNEATRAAMAAMGVTFEDIDDGLRVHGVGLAGLRLPPGDLDCGNSGTTMRLLGGLLVGQRFGTRLVGDASLTRRPMKRIVGPLRARGGHIDGVKKGDNVYPPLSVAPRLEDEPLLGIEYDMPIASAQVKSALLLSGLYAEGPTAIKEPVLSRDHTERMMRALGIPLETAGPMTVLDPRDWRGGFNGFDWEVPGDLSSAAFVLAAAQVVGGEVTLSGVGANPTRSGFLDALRAMRSGVQLVWKGDTGSGEPMCDLVTLGGTVAATSVGGELLTRMIDEVPAFCAVAAVAPGVSVVRDAAELRVKESDRIATKAKVLRAFSVPCEELEDGMKITGGGRLTAATVESHGDHRIAMAAAVLALAADGESRIVDVDCVETSFPGFPELLNSLGADIKVETGGAVDGAAEPDSAVEEPT